jgi:hypothetical protein
MQTGNRGSVMGWGRRHAVKAVIYTLMAAVVIGLSGCIWVPWGPWGGPGGGGGGPRGGGGGPGPGPHGEEEMRR